MMGKKAVFPESEISVRAFALGNYSGKLVGTTKYGYNEIWVQRNSGEAKNGEVLMEEET